MGQNARRRSALKIAARGDRQATRRPGVTKTLTRLRARAAEITTLQQFEEIVAAAHPDHRGSIRKLMAPMLRAGLPCCGPAQLAHVLEQQGKTVDAWEHTRLCPSRNRVQLVSM